MGVFNILECKFHFFKRVNILSRRLGGFLFSQKHFMRYIYFLFITVLLIPAFSFGQSYELSNGQSMCMTGKGAGQDATINPYAAEEFSFALVENMGAVEFQIRIESPQRALKEFPIQPKGLVVIKLNREDILYFDSLTKEKAQATIKYTLDESELPPPPPPSQF